MYCVFERAEPKKDTKRKGTRKSVTMTIRKNPKCRTQRKKEKKSSSRKLLFGRTLSEESVREILQSAHGMGCNTVFDIGAGYGTILKLAESEGFEQVAGVEREAPARRQQPNVFYGMTFAEFVQNGSWVREATQKTLFYVYEGGIWSRNVCEEALAVVQKVAVVQDVICIIVPPPAVSLSVYEDSWDWELALAACHKMEGLFSVQGNICADGQVEKQQAHFWTVTSEQLQQWNNSGAVVHQRMSY